MIPLAFAVQDMHSNIKMTVALIRIVVSSLEK